MEISQPKTKSDFEKYYELRWRILRKPWNQPKGSEKDDLEEQGIHIFAVENSKVLGVGRGHFNSKDEAQIRYMAVDTSFQNKGIGTKIIRELENRLKAKGAKTIILNSRESAVDFYKKNGYKIIGEAPTMFGTIKHFKMKKEIK